MEKIKLTRMHQRLNSKEIAKLLNEIVDWVTEKDEDHKKIWEMIIHLQKVVLKLKK